jgi:Ala-tRNA(Pro) deacylase
MTETRQDEGDRRDGAAGAAPSPALPTSPEALLARLEALGIAHRTTRHPPVFTVEEAKALRGDLPGAHIKNLFLRNKKGDLMWLVVALEDRPIDLKVLGERLEAGRLSFGSAERLMANLGVLPGAVTPLALINDTAQRVKVVLDAGLLRLDPVNCHPLTNDMTTSISAADLLKFIAACGHQPQILELDGPAPHAA